MDRAIDCLGRFGQRLEDVPAAGIRAVATDSVRVAKNGRAFKARAEAALGHPIEILSGTEEARLIYRGVVEELPYRDGARQLCMDIGGGSTECVLGVGLRPEHLTSLHQGCVSATRKFFADGAIDHDRMRRATNAACLEFERLRGPYFRRHWSRVVGSSGTINAVQEIIRASGWGDSITLPSLILLRRALIEAGHHDKLALDGLKPTRAPVLAGGLSILLGAFQTLPIDEMSAVKSALREGVMLDTLGRLTHHDVRERTITRMMERYRIDEDQAQRVERTALIGLRRSGWFPKPGRRAAEQYLSWAARLHEVGPDAELSRLSQARRLRDRQQRDGRLLPGRQARRRHPGRRPPPPHPPGHLRRAPGPDPRDRLPPRPAPAHRRQAAPQPQLAAPAGPGRERRRRLDPPGLPRGLSGKSTP